MWSMAQSPSEPLTAIWHPASTGLKHRPGLEPSIQHDALAFEASGELATEGADTLDCTELILRHMDDLRGARRFPRGARV